MLEALIFFTTDTSSSDYQNALQAEGRPRATRQRLLVDLGGLDLLVRIVQLPWQQTKQTTGLATNQALLYGDKPGPHDLQKADEVVSGVRSDVVTEHATDMSENERSVLSNNFKMCQLAYR